MKHKDQSRLATVTLDMARALDAFAVAGTYEAAAARLGKGHTSVVYALRQLEARTGLVVLDRSAYRTRLTPAGQRLLEGCRAMLTAERQVSDACAELRAGWEPLVRVVFDAIYPAQPLLEAIGDVRRAGATTRFVVSADSLQGVERRFIDDDAELMMTVLPVTTSGLRVTRLPTLRAHLVAHRRHPLARLERVLTRADVAAHVLLTVRGSDPRLNLPTRGLEQQSMVVLPDFHSKKAAILQQLGFGWLPDWLTSAELNSGALVALRVDEAHVHVFEPRAAFRAGRLGPAGRAVLDALKQR